MDSRASLVVIGKIVLFVTPYEEKVLADTHTQHTMALTIRAGRNIFYLFISMVAGCFIN